MKVAIVAPYPEFGRAPNGGVEAVVFKLVEFLMANGCECHVLAVNSAGSGIHQIKSGLTVYRLSKTFIPGPLEFWTIIPWRIRSLLKKIRPDITHVHGAAIWAAVAPGPVLFTVHGVTEREVAIRNPIFGKLIYPILACVEGGAFRIGVRNVVLINPYVRELRKIGSAHRVWDIPNAIADVFFEDKKVSHNAVSDGKRIVWVGNPGARKNLLYLIDIVSAMVNMGKDPVVEIFGVFKSETGNYIGRCFNEIERRGLIRHFNFHGKQAQAVICDVMDTSNVLVMTSIQETAPCAVSEALARGLYVVAPSAFGLPHMITSPAVGFLYQVSSSPHEVAVALVEYLKADEGREERVMLAEQYRGSIVGKATLGAYRAISSAS